MKSKYIYQLFSLLLLVLVASCSSDDPTLDPETPAGKTHSIKFVIKGIEVESSEIKTRSDNNELSLKYLEYWVYKANEIPNFSAPEKNILHSYIKGENLKNDISIELPEGDYKIVFYASDREDITPKENPFGILAVGYQYQMFSKILAFTVSQDKLTPIQEVILEREVGQVQFVIEDLSSLPANVKSIRPFLIGYYWFSGLRVLAQPYYLNLGNEGSVEYNIGEFDKSFPSFKKEQFSNKSFSFYSIPSAPSATGTGHIMPGTLYLMGCTDDNLQTFDPTKPIQGQNDKIVFIRKVGEYTVTKNQITRYSGKIGPVNVGEGSVIIDDSWDEEIITVE